MAHNVGPDQEEFARYRLASNRLSGLRSDLATLYQAPDGRDRQVAMELNIAATTDAQAELEAAFRAYFP